MFCTIEDAWGSKDFQNSTHSSFVSINPDKEHNSFTSTKSNNLDNTFNKEMFEQSDKPESFKSNEYTFEDKVQLFLKYRNTSSLKVHRISFLHIS